MFSKGANMYGGHCKYSHVQTPTTMWGANIKTYKFEEVVNLLHMKMTVTQSMVCLAVNLPKEKTPGSHFMCLTG